MKTYNLQLTSENLIPIRIEQSDRGVISVILTDNKRFFLSLIAYMHRLRLFFAACVLPPNYQN